MPKSDSSTHPPEERESYYNKGIISGAANWLIHMSGLTAESPSIFHSTHVLAIVSEPKSMHTEASPLSLLRGIACLLFLRNL